MHDGLAGAIIVGVIFYGIVSIVKAVSDYLLRKRMVQLGHIDQESTAILSKQRSSHLESLKWGLIILFAGIGFILISFPGIDLDSPLPFGIMAVSVSLGFLIYFYLTQKMFKEPKNEKIPYV